MSIEFWLPWVGTVTAGLMLAAPMIQAKEFSALGDVGALTPKFYLFQFLNCVGWTVYGVLLSSVAITLCNAFGIVTAVYCILHFLATTRKQELEGRPSLGSSFKGSLWISAAALGVGVGLCGFVIHVASSDLTSARQIAGLFSDFVCMCMLVSPLEQMKRIMETKNAETLSPPLVSVALVNGVIWSWFGALRVDPYIFIPNAVGVLSMTVQAYFLLKFGRGKSIQPEGNAREEDAFSLGITTARVVGHRNSDTDEISTLGKKD